MPPYRHRNRWRYRKWVTLRDGRKVRVSGTPAVNTNQAAEAAERAHVERVLDPSRSANTKEVPTLHKFMPEFMATYVAGNNKPSERVSKEGAFRVHLLPAFGRLRLDEIGTREVEKFKASKLTTLKPKSLNNLLTILGKTLRYAAEIGIIDKIPRVRFVKVFAAPFDFLEAEEFHRLIEANAQHPETLASILLAGDAGLRQGEIRALQWGDLDLEAGRIFVQRNDYRGHIGSPKGGRMRRLPMTERLRAALKRARHLRGSWVLCDARGERLTRTEVDSVLRRAVKAARLRSIGWHTLRHTFCSALAMRNVPVRTIQELAGHASITTTMRYMHLTASAADDAIRVLESRPIASTKKAEGE
jgi:integrase